MSTFLEFVKSKSKKKVVLILGSARSADCCPNEMSKTHKLADRIVKEFKDSVSFETIDLSVKCDGINVLPCKGCTSTSSFHCHWPCIESDQRVHLLDGFKEIKDVRVGDVLQDGNKVTKHLLTSKDEKIYELKLNDGRCLKLTSNHKVKTLSKNRYRDKSSNYLFYRKEEWKELKNLSVGDYIPSIEIDDIISSKEKEEDYLYTIYGMLCGDGTTCGNTAILYADSGNEEFINSVCDHYSKHIISILPHSTSDCKIRETQKKTAKMIKINFGTKIGKKFKSLFVKNKATERRLNLKAFKNKNQIFNFLNGWISTDGSINRSNRIDIHNTSYDLLRDLQLLLSRISVKSNITDLRHLSTEIKGKAYKRCSYLTISDQDSLRTIIENVSLLHPQKQNSINQYRLKRKKLKHHFSRVKSIDYVCNGEVYDIEVENSHFFNCEGIKVHNCDCYSKESDPKDLMYEQDVYKKLEECDGFFVITPINWSACSSVVKSFFDRLVCASLTMTVDDAKDMLGEDDVKNSKKTRALEKTERNVSLLKNHLEGKYAGFFGHGNDGGSDYREFAKDKNNFLPVLPDSLVEFNKTNPKEDVSRLLDPLVRQCVYSGINVPDDCVNCVVFGYGISYSEVNDLMKKTEKLFNLSTETFKNFLKNLS